MDRLDDYSGLAAPIERFAPTDTASIRCWNAACPAATSRRLSGRPGSAPITPGSTFPALDRKGRIVHAGGVAAVPGLYLLGLPFLRRRKSSYMHGAEDDARDIASTWPDTWTRTRPAGTGDWRCDDGADVEYKLEPRVRRAIRQ